MIIGGFGCDGTLSMETPDILNNFRLLTQTKKEVKFINDYKGIPLELNATVSNVLTNTVMFSAPRYKLASFASKKQMFIQNDLFPEIIKSRIKEIDIARGYAVLTDFEYVNTLMIERKPARIQPDNLIEITLRKNGDADVKAALIDISERGMGIYMITPLSAQTKVNVHVQIPGKGASTYSKLEFLGITVYTILENNPNREMRYRIGMQIFPDKYAKQIITEYISRRQAELLEEINKSYQSLQ